MDQLGVGLNVTEDSRQSGGQGSFRGEVTIVRSVLPRVLPQPLGGIQLR